MSDRSTLVHLTLRLSAEQGTQEQAYIARLEIAMRKLHAQPHGRCTLTKQATGDVLVEWTDTFAYMVALVDVVAAANGVGFTVIKVENEEPKAQAKKWGAPVGQPATRKVK